MASSKVELKAALKDSSKVDRWAASKAEKMDASKAGMSAVQMAESSAD